MEKNILAVILDDRDAYTKLLPFLEESDFSEQGRVVLGEIEKYYSLDSEVPYVNREVLIERIAKQHPKHADTFANVVASLECSSTKNIVYDYFELKKQTVGDKLAGALLTTTDNTREINKLLELYKKLDEGDIIEDEFETYVGLDIESIVDPLRPENLIKVFPKNLNDTLGGGVPPGTHMLVYARPENGKSAFVINMAAKFCMNGHRALYIGNEDPQSAMRMRFLNRFSGRDRHEGACH